MCGFRKWLRAQGGPYAEVGLKNHNTTMKEREREGRSVPYMHAHT
jgi:hypothetical protein